MKKQCILLCSLFLAWSACGQIADPALTEVWEPVPRVVTTGKIGEAPSDAIVLFDGTDLKEWMSMDSSAARWIIEGDHMTVDTTTGDIMTRRVFGDCQLHIEWRTPTSPLRDGQNRGNSGIFFQNRYEVQVLDNYNSRTYSNGQAGAIYKQSIPLVNACKKPGEWQSYDIVFMAPVFDQDGIKITPGRLTVFQNGVLVQNNVEIRGTTQYIGMPQNEAHGKGPLKLQDHDNQVSYRNIWIREL